MDPTAMETLLAKQAITEVLNRYCRAMDRMDDDLGRSVFWPDAVADYGDIFQGTGHGFIDFVHKSHEAMLAHAHRVSNILIEVDGGAATSECYVQASFALPTPEGGQKPARANGRYLDRWSRRGGRWALAHRRYVHDWDEGFVDGASLQPVTGRRDPADVSYGYLRAQISS